MGVPATHIKTLQEDGKFTTHVSENTLRKHREWLAGKYEVGAYLSPSTTDPDTYHPALEVAGSINVELLSDDELMR